MLKDSLVQQGKRKEMLGMLMQNKISDKGVLKAIFLVPRHAFLDSAFEDHAYELKAFPIGAEQTISNPLTVATQTQLLDVKKGEKVLEIGNWIRYQSAVLLKMGVQLYTIERQSELVQFSKMMFSKLKLDPFYQYFGDGYEGLPHFAPFDKILVTCGAPEIPPKLVEQLALGGKMVVPVGEEGKPQKMIVIEKNNEGKLLKKIVGDAAFVPMLKNTN